LIFIGVEEISQNYIQMRIYLSPCIQSLRFSDEQAAHVLSKTKSDHFIIWQCKYSFYNCTSICFGLMIRVMCLLCH